MTIAHPKRAGLPMPLGSLALISGATLAYEILLMRLYSMIQWHHFAYMVISLALLGYGVSGTLLFLTQHRLLPRYPRVYLLHALGFAVAAPVCFLMAQRLPLNPEEILWDSRQPLILLAQYLLLALPFLLAANAVALTFMRFHDRVGRAYAVDLLGAGAGALAIIGLLFVMEAQQALRVIAGAGVLTAALAALEMGVMGRRTVIALLLLAASPWAVPDDWLNLKISQYKGLPGLLRVPQTQVETQRSSPLARLDVVASPLVPLRHAPGMSIRASHPIPEQRALVTDADAVSAITRFGGDPQSLAFLSDMTSALPYHLRQPTDVLVLGAGAGMEVLQAIHHGSVRIDAVELNPQVIALLRGPYADFSGGLYDREDVQVHRTEARAFVRATSERYDLIQVALLDSFNASAAGLHALNESTLYTVEALRELYRRLEPGGILAITRWIKLPPRDTLKLFATAVRSLRAEGVQDPGDQLLLMRSWQTGTLLIKRGAFTDADLAAAQAFGRKRAFDLAWFPGIREDQINRYNRLREPHFYRAAQALLGPEAETFSERYKFNIEPASDDRPYFFHFFKWRVLPEVLALRGRGGMPLLEWGYLILVATLAQALLASAVLILLPLALRRRWRVDAGASAGSVLTFFGAIGLGFLFIEIAFMQKLILHLQHPLYAAATVLSTFLVGAGLGSAASGRLSARLGERRLLWAAVMLISVLTVGHLVAIDPLFDALPHMGQGTRTLLAALLLAPLAFAMGMPFPLAMRFLGRQAPGMIPWAWGINGCASVVSAVLATLGALHYGFSAVLMAAVLLYWLAGAGYIRMTDAVAPSGISR